MCGRYVMARATGDLVALGGALAPDEELVLRQNWNVAPTADVPILVAHGRDGADAGEGPEHGADRRIHVARWGLVPPWAKEAAVGSRAFNARSETVAQKPTFRAAVRARRCAVPVEGYYEWKAPVPGSKGPDGKAARKQPYLVVPAAAADAVGDPAGSRAPLIWFAGLYEWWKDPEADARGEDPWVLSTTILTMPAPDADDADETLAALGSLHDRLPVPLATGAAEGELLEAWLAPEKLDSAEAAEDLVRAVTGAAHDHARTWALRPVDPGVGNVRNNGPELVRERGEQQDPLL